MLREQVEERLKFYEEGIVPRKNVDVMKLAMKEIGMMDMDIDEEEGHEEEEKKVEVTGELIMSPFLLIHFFFY